ncbi:phosphatase 2A regulatory subunit-related protein, putative [Plasmodium gallinaceum]|uniref:Phosphatase 2A regulatory subunit-related protein, putative n=1 Tax=Plasmodium gallinaceum TaxID=5849 RepID=A0A1J1GN75_PLAGA|nr:phosphatase 2A regulatory subunit-related protein, putative [Plasmodium gallinaceum]CRG93919.1 phosphatase 2A regulatory subunit-related protein, putative [Plasmodium gallinaceum]
MNKHSSIGDTTIKSEKMSFNFKPYSQSFSEKSEIKELKNFARFFLQGELMRQFLLDEDIWLFIQNVKIKLKEDPTEIDNWLDNQLHIAKTNASNFFNSDIPPFHHSKKNVEYNNSKIDKDYEKNSFINNDFFKKSKYNDKYMNKKSDTKELEKDMIIENAEMNRKFINELIQHNLENKEKRIGDYKKIEYSVNMQEKNYDFNEKKLDNIDNNNNSNIKVENGINRITVIDNKYESNNNLKEYVDKNSEKNVINNKDYMKRRKKEIGENDLSTNNNYNEETEEKKILMNIKSHLNLENNLKNDIFNKKQNIINTYENNSANVLYSNKNDFTITNNNIINNENDNDLRDDNNYINDLRNNVSKNKVDEDKFNERKKTYENKLVETKLNELQFKTNKLVKKEIDEEIRNEEPFHLNEFNENELAENKIKESSAHYKNKSVRIELAQNKSTENKFKNEFNENLCNKNNKIVENKLNIKVKNNNNEMQILIPKVTVKIGRLMNEDRDMKLKKIFNQCNNKMNLEAFENLIVVNFLKIGKYMSHTLFSKIDKVNSDFITYENLKKFFYNRFIDGTKDPSYYDDEKYKNMFKKGKKDIFESYFYNSIQNEYTKNNLIHDNETGDFPSSQKDHIDVPFKKCSIINFFNAIKDEKKDHLEFKDFDAYVREILRRNKSLKFLLDHVEFLERYIESVIVRLYYHIDINDTNKIYLNDLRKHDLAHVWCSLDDSIKVQHVRQYFSYSHFYVYYCTFCQTSSCKDMLIDDNDLYRFDNHSLNDFIVNRIWSRISMKLGGPNQKYMCLNDWIYFIMNYEDMTSNRSIEFWFKLIDLDADCVIRDHEIQVFFNIQMERLKSHYLEEPKFEDWLCQMNDAIRPSNEGNFTLSDFKKNKKYAAKFFGCLVSLSKLLAWESRDVHKELQIETEFPHWTPWEIFCKTKYDELCYIENESCYDENFDSYENYDSKNLYILDSD